MKTLAREASEQECPKLPWLADRPILQVARPRPEAAMGSLTQFDRILPRGDEAVLALAFVSGLSARTK